MGSPPRSPDSTRPRLPPLLVVVLGLLVTSTAAILIRFAQVEAPSLVIATWRVGLASVVLAPILLARHRASLRALTLKQVSLGLISGVFLALHFATWISSLEFTTVASSLVLVATSPLFVALIAPRVLQEQLTPWVLAGLAVALVGGVGIGLSDACEWEAGLRCPQAGEFLRGRAVIGDLLALAGAAAGAGYFMIGRRLRRELSLLPYIGLSYGAAALVLACLTALAGMSILGYRPITYLLFAALALGPQLLGHSSFSWALRYLPVGFVSIVLLAEPIGSTVLAFLILGESPGPLKLISVMLVLLGIYLASRSPGTGSQAG